MCRSRIVSAPKYSSFRRESGYARLLGTRLEDSRITVTAVATLTVWIERRSQSVTTQSLAVVNTGHPNFPRVSSTLHIAWRHLGFPAYPSTYCMLWLHTQLQPCIWDYSCSARGNELQVVQIVLENGPCTGRYRFWSATWLPVLQQLFVFSHFRVSHGWFWLTLKNYFLYRWGVAGFTFELGSICVHLCAAQWNAG